MSRKNGLPGAPDDPEYGDEFIATDGFVYEWAGAGNGCYLLQ